MKKTALSLAIGALALAASTAYGAAFMLTEQSAVMLGRAYAGAGVAGDDASAPFYNPAGMTLLPGTQVQFTGIGVSMHQNLKLNNGFETDCRNKTEFLPSFYITHQINPEWWVGLSVASPFGLSTNCDDLSTVGYGHRGTEAKLTDFDINPSIAWKPTERFSVAAGISLQYAKAKLGMSLPNIQMVPSGYPDPYPAQIPALVGLQHGLEDGSSWAWGWNIGFMCQPTDNFRFGISYRSAIKHKASGYLNLTEAGIALPSKVTIKTPDTVYASAKWDATNNLSVTGTIRWAKWKNVNEWHLVQGGSASSISPFLEDVAIRHHYKNTWLYALGADYKINSDWTIRGGVGFEKNALEDECCRTAVIPDGDRLFLALGATYNVTKNWTIDFALLRVEGLGTSRFFDNDKENAQLLSMVQHSPTYGNNKPEAVGEWDKQNSWIYGMNLRYKF